MSNAHVKGLIKHSTTLPRKRDNGRSLAYRAEDSAFGGPWHTNQCTAPVLNWRDAQDLIEMALDWAVENLLPDSWKARAVRPQVRRSNAGNAYCRGDFRGFGWETALVFGRNPLILRASVILHEVAHWCVAGGAPHGDAWQQTYVSLVREFMGDAYADPLAESFNNKPVTVRRQRRTYTWEIEIGPSWEKVKASNIEFDDSSAREDIVDGYPRKCWVLYKGNWGRYNVRARETASSLDRRGITLVDVATSLAS